MCKISIFSNICLRAILKRNLEELLTSKGLSSKNKPLIFMVSAASRRFSGIMVPLSSCLDVVSKPCVEGVESSKLSGYSMSLGRHMFDLKKIFLYEIFVDYFASFLSKICRKNIFFLSAIIFWCPYRWKGTETSLHATLTLRYDSMFILYLH